ncbi:hypothetical protein [Methanonatronarchaeum sp. AMET6-2]|uniref:hypothetical protein n=1 Tax=Methanonatronarchaeum sp. AMET6-2 TaxID=2933293 RepID=UPI00122739F1|nr:hypothetical protein [Methanonatronarchaeum sp. AMET6-2]RZN62390.1 MAG: hypothetical protein EF811_02900 [Methanonatronarchaeia archaeon]UOY09636.1 hypothetical protein MU439_05105 [Methanonatronarchaeum sp. AMET6-2]
MKLKDEELKKFYLELKNEVSEEGRSTTNTGEIVRKLKNDRDIHDQEEIMEIIKEMSDRDYIQSYGMTDWLLKEIK